MGIEAAIIGSAVAGGIASSRGASKAARAQRQAAEQAAATEERMLERQLAETAPFRDLSLQQLNRLAELYGPGGQYVKTPTMDELLMDPGFSFRMSEGEKALARMQSARGGLLGGGAIKAGVRYGQEMGSQEFQNAFARARQQRADVTNALLGIGGFGPSLASSAAGAIGQTGSNIANLQMGAGQARASGYLGQANALSQALGQAGMGYGMYKGGYFGSPSSGLSNESLGAILPGVTVTGRRLASVAPSSFSGPR
jgi:hypothetical protein